MQRRLIPLQARVLVEATRWLSAGHRPARTGLAYRREDVSRLARAFDTIAAQSQPPPTAISARRNWSSG